MDDFDKKGFKLIDSYVPSLHNGTYKVTFEQKIHLSNNTTSSPIDFKTTKNFGVVVNSNKLTDNAVFNVQPAPNQQGDFSTELPYMVINDPSFPWIKEQTTENEKSSINENNNPIPWLALIVISEKEVYEEKDVKYGNLKDEAGEKIQEDGETKGVYFNYEKCSLCQNNDLIHLVTVRKEIFNQLIPTKNERVWLTHCKRVDLSDTDDVTAQNDGYFSVIIANRFPPCNNGQITNAQPIENDDVPSVKNTVHLIAAHLYDDKNMEDGKGLTLEAAGYVKMISLYHWNIYSDVKENADKSFKKIMERLNKDNLTEKALKVHYLRSGEKTYSWYHSPIQPMKYNRPQRNAFNGENKYTSDGRLIYNTTNGIFDVSYAAAFNLGRIVTLSHGKEAQQIANWRNNQKKDNHINTLANVKKGIGIDHLALKGVINNLKERNLK